MIKSFTEIQRLAVFTDFVWDQEVRDSDGRILYFSPLNIIYGRNYSGKTTLSRVVRSLETGHVAPKYDSPRFTVTFHDGTTANESSLTAHGNSIRVFNEDFVRDNLRVFVDEDDTIAAFAVLGEDNATLAVALSKKEKELGAEDIEGSLMAEVSELQRQRNRASYDLQNAISRLDNLLRDEARRIKENPKYSDVNYDIRKIKMDVDSILKDSIAPFTPSEITVKEGTLQETKKEQIPALSRFDLRLPALLSRTLSLLSQQIQPSKPIQELLNDAALQEWVHKGRELHKGVRTNCAFCNNPIPDDLWAALDRHFDKESESLRSDLKNLAADIGTELKTVEGVTLPQPEVFYSALKLESENVMKSLENMLIKYKVALVDLNVAVAQRLRNIFKPVQLKTIDDPSRQLDSVLQEYEIIRTQNNDYSESLSNEQEKARESLRLNKVAEYLKKIAFYTKQEEIDNLKLVFDDKKSSFLIGKQNVTAVQAEIASLKGRMRDERNGAEKVNEYLSHHFGHPSLTLNAVLKESDDKPRYRFEVHRDGERAFQLSEGERRLIAFCYFMARLNDVETSGTNPIIWIDDPISSLDDNHVFFIYSLIRTEIIERAEYKQLFISTHSLNFLKYLRRVSGSINVDRKYFIVERRVGRSVIQQMPKHLRTFATEFHYLFHRIYNCAHADEADEKSSDLYYSFGNDLRKFLEMYLYIRYPDGDEQSGVERLRRFVGNDPIAAAVTERVENEYSHLNSQFERAFIPVDVPAMKAMAILVLTRMKELDQPQYDSLLKSIGKMDQI